MPDLAQDLFGDTPRASGLGGHRSPDDAGASGVYKRLSVGLASASHILAKHNFIKQEPAAERTCGDLARDVVFSWTKTAGGDHHFRATDSVFDCFFETGIVVADDRFEFDFDAETIELFGEPKAVGVCAIGRKQLRSDGDDFG